LNFVDIDVKKFFKSKGRLMTLVTADGETSFYAFLQPLRYKNKMYIDGKVTELRYESTRRYLLISTPDVTITHDDEGGASYIKDDKYTYNVNHSELVYFGKKAAYRWSVIHLTGELKQGEV